MFPAIMGAFSALTSASGGSGDAANAAPLTNTGKITIGSKVVGSGKATSTQDVSSALASIDWKGVLLEIGLVVSGIGVCGLLLFAILRRPSKSKKKG